MPLSDKVRQRIFLRASYRCEYCQTSHRLIGMPPVIDHILPSVSGGSDHLSNLAAACYRCNEFKGAKTQAIDPATGQMVNLFHPRQQLWQEHFSWANGGIHIIGLTPVGRATVIALRLNNEYSVQARMLWIERDWHPPVN